MNETMKKDRQLISIFHCCHHFLCCINLKLIKRLVRRNWRRHLEQVSLMIVTLHRLHNRSSRQTPGGGGGGDSNIKKVGVLVVSLRGVNFRFWSRLGC